jgi:AcrR family transcriptional regulator
MASTKALKPRKTAVQARSRFTVGAIYEAAVQVFSENGYAGATTDLIAERAGVSVGTLYQYFPNKQAILVGIWNRGMEDADRTRDSFANCHRREGSFGPETMRKIFQAVYRLHKDSVRPHLFFEEVPQPDFIKERLSEKESIAIGMFVRALECSVNVRKRKLEVAARVIYEVTERLIHRYLTHFRHEMSEDDFITEASDVINRYVFADGPLPQRSRRGRKD